MCQFLFYVLHVIYIYIYIYIYIELTLICVLKILKIRKLFIFSQKWKKLCNTNLWNYYLFSIENWDLNFNIQIILIKKCHNVDCIMFPSQRLTLRSVKGSRLELNNKTIKKEN
jgi:hypothetical protein